MDPNTHAKIEPVIWLLSLLVVIFLVATFAAEAFFKSDAVFFQAIVSGLSAFSGALLMRVTGRQPLGNTSLIDNSKAILIPPPPVKNVTPSIAPVKSEEA